MKTLSKDYAITNHGSGQFTIASPSGNCYDVNLVLPSCDCPDFLYRGDQTGTCKHIKMAQRRQEFEEYQALIEEAQRLADAEHITHYIIDTGHGYAISTFGTKVHPIMATLEPLVSMRPCTECGKMTIQAGVCCECMVDADRRLSDGTYDSAMREVI